MIGGDASNQTQVYYSETDISQNKTSIPTSRNYQQATVVGNKIYAISGKGIFTVEKEVRVIQRCCPQCDASNTEPGKASVNRDS